MAIVYKITNKTNNKSYVGYTSRTLDQRWRSHQSSSRQGSKFRFHSAIRKYGIDDWTLETLFESESVNECKKTEEYYIKEMNLMNIGYNAKPGGCGGWIVKDENYDDWIQKNKERAKETLNGNSTKHTNEELLDIATQICYEFKRIVSHRVLVKVCEERGIRFPKTFRPFRFGGKYENMIKIIEEKTSMIYNPMIRTDEHREKLRQANLGKKYIIVEGKKKYVNY
jgi:group I intron endonuclease